MTQVYDESLMTDDEAVKNHLNAVAASHGKLSRCCFCKEMKDTAEQYANGGVCAKCFPVAYADVIEENCKNG